MTEQTDRAPTVVVFDQFAPARPEWEQLLAVAAVSPYQSFVLQNTWMETIGRENGLDPLIIIARDSAGPLALLPFDIERRLTLRIASFIGGRETNFNIGVFRPGAVDATLARRLLMDAARLAPHAVDLYYFRNQPARFNGVDNPLKFPEARDSASFAYGMTLPATQDELAARFSKDTRKKLRKKETRLAELGALTFEHCATGARAQAIAAALMQQKTQRFTDMGVSPLFASAGMRAFVERLAAETGDGALELHALSAGERIVATYAGFTRGGRFSAMLNSFDMDEAIARSSPGDLLLHALLRNLVDRKMTHFDLGAGEARYKQSVCDETIELFELVVPVTVKGALAAPLLTQVIRLKRWVKQMPRLASLYFALRRGMARGG